MARHRPHLITDTAHLTIVTFMPFDSISPPQVIVGCADTVYCAQTLSRFFEKQPKREMKKTKHCVLPATAAT